MSTKKREISEDEKRNKDIKSDIFLGFIGLIFMLLQYFLFKKTLINPYIILISFIVIGIIAMFFDYKRYTFVYEYQGISARIVCFLQNTLIYGGIIGLFFLSINYFLADTKLKRNNYKIKDIKVELSGKRMNPEYACTVLLEGSYEKSFYVVVNPEFLSEYSELKLTTNEGLLGFDVVRFSNLER